MNTFICTSCQRTCHSSANFKDLLDDNCPYPGCKGKVIAAEDEKKGLDIHEKNK